MTRVLRTAEERRAQIQTDAAAMGIDEAFISTLVDTFYDRVRADPDLGPIFNNKIADNWPSHLATLKRFWSSVAPKYWQLFRSPHSCAYGSYRGAATSL